MAKKIEKKAGSIPENAPPGLFINAQYLKDLSFENPNPLDAYKNNDKPDISVNVNTAVKKLPENAFETYAASSRVINVTAPGHGLTNGTTYRFRGTPALTSAGGGTFQYNNPADFDGITGTNIAKAAGYAITTGLYVSGSRNTTDYSVANFFHFTVDTDTATKGGVKGGGVGCSVGPVTLSA